MFNENQVPKTIVIAPAAEEVSFISKVYGWMSVGLVVTATTAFLALNNPSLMAMILGNKIVFYGLLLGELGLVMFITGAISRISAQTASFLFLLYSMMNGLTLSSIFLVYTGSSIASTFLITAATFAAMSAYGYFTKKDLTTIGNICMMALIGILIASLVNIFIGSSQMSYAISYIGLLVFVGLTAYDTQKIKSYYNGSTSGSEDSQKASIVGALILYLDFINLFIMLLNLLGRKK